MNAIATRASLALAFTLAACTPGPGGNPPVVPSASATPAPSASPAGPAPSAAPSASPSAGFSLTSGRLLKGYDFKGLAGVYHEPGLDRFAVVDALTRDPFARLQLLRFQSDGTFLASNSLALPNMPAPTSVDGLAFDQRGIAVFAYRDDERFVLSRFVAGSPAKADVYPFFELQRAGVSAVRAEGAVLSVAAVALNETGTEKTGGRITVARATGEADEPAQALFQLADPFYPTHAMAFGPAGVLYLAGATREGALKLKRLAPDQTLSDMPVSFTALPDGLWTGPDGELYLAWTGTAQPARIRRLNAQGESEGETEVRLAGGGFLLTVKGITFDAGKRMVIAGSGYDGASREVRGLYVF